MSERPDDATRDVPDATEPRIATAEADQTAIDPAADEISDEATADTGVVPEGDDGQEAALRASSEDDPAPRPIPH